MRILVTGGAGFIGSAVIRFLLSETRCSVVNLDCLTYAGNLHSLAQVAYHPNYCFEQVDLRQRDAVSRVLVKHQPDAILHLAAETHVDRSIEGPDVFIQTNLVGSANLLEATRSYWQTLQQDTRRRFRYVHISTDEVYGDLGEREGLFTEDTPYAPSSPYAASKAGSDHLARAWARTYDLPVIVTNCSNNYGPYQFPEKLIPHMILNALKGHRLPVYGDGRQVRDWLYVEDHARALWEVLCHGCPGETYNIGGHNEQRNIDVVTAICDLLDEFSPDRKPDDGYRSLITFVRDRPGHDTRYAIDASKIDRELGWRPRETFPSGLRKTVSWYLQNHQWWEQVLDGSYRLERIGAGEQREQA